ncbi:uncharacterized protein B0I36DRAFT_344306 [Microdochium trichocladiopsis]|uniref:Uncharacterized protein n=1 Tax=Microdochium trichocladiopsis TaxID=1682393 RepID=A0A9P8YKA8_9PEZI|nr:uncharacterized protein B0I36DRAFT_344306 [Microdochium trichocladiopsis]KAH7040585.1 hypothetical protein B0I36DRAFT_344306 [Microdochium trichocladiopsis]
MKTFSATVLALLAASLAGAQTLAPSPTESIGCEPHGDHWHCDGPASATGTAGAVTTSTHDHEDHDDHEDETGTASLAPSPTESIGCEPHGDHWHCDGPATTTGGSVGAATTTASHSHTDDDHTDHASGTGSLAPSPTESIGCEPHGDHWHCDGPASTSGAPVSTRSSTATTSSTVVPAAAGAVMLNRAAVVGGLLAAVAL